MTTVVAYGVCGLLVLVAAVVITAGLLGGDDWLAPESRSAELARLAATRQWRTSDTAAALVAAWPGAPFGRGVARRSGPALHAEAGPLPVTIFDYGYDLPGRAGVLVRAVAVYVVWLPAPVSVPVWSHRTRRWSWRVEHDAVLAWTRGPLRAADVAERLVRLSRICAALPLAAPAAPLAASPPD